MAHIETKTSKAGIPSYKATIIIKRGGAIQHRESKTFARKKLAVDWSKAREVELQSQTAYGIKEAVTIKTVIDNYLFHYPPSGRSKRYELQKLSSLPIASMDANKLGVNDLLNHIKSRNKEVQPQTARTDMVWLKIAIESMRHHLKLSTDLSIFSSASLLLRREGLITNTRSRDRLPTRGEIMALARYFKNRGGTIPMLDIILFAMSTARRQGEIFKLRWADLDTDKSTILVRDLKHPNLKHVHKRAKLSKFAMRIINRQPHSAALIFPYNAKTAGSYFTDACRLLGIEDLHFHDLRHFATTKVFRGGYSIPQVQLFTLHANWSHLQRYTNLKAEDLD